MPPPAPTEAACIGREDVVVLLQNVANPVMNLRLPPLELLNHSRDEINLSIQVFYSGKDGLLEVKERSNVKRSGCDHSAN